MFHIPFRWVILAAALAGLALGEATPGPPIMVALAPLLRLPGLA